MFLPFDLFKKKFMIFYNSVGDKKKISYHKFFSDASILANAIKSDNIPPRTSAIIQARETYEQLLLFWGATLANLIPAPLAFADSPQKLSKLQNIKKILPNCIVIDKSLLKELETTSANKNNLEDEFYYRKLFNDNHAVVEKSIPFFWQFSSGSTSQPKGISMTCSMIQTNIKESLDRLGFKHEDKFLSWMPMTHDFGMIMGHLAPLNKGCDQVLIDSKLFLRRPYDWLKIASEENCSLLTTTNFANNFLSRQRNSLKNFPDLSKVKAIINGAEPIMQSVTKNFKKILLDCGLKNNALTTAYGLAEGTLIVTIKDLDDECCFLEVDSQNVGIKDQINIISKFNDYDKPQASKSGITIANVGKAISSIDLKILDDNNNQLEELKVGHVFINGPTVTNNILNYNGNDLSSGYLTGDIGFIFNECLYLLGRGKDHFKVNGISYFSNEVESFLTDKLSLEHGQCIIAKNDFSKNDEIVCFIKEPSLEPYYDIVKNIFEVCYKAFGLEISTFFQIAKIPRTTSGKIQRFKLIMDCLNLDNTRNFKNKIQFDKREHEEKKSHHNSTYKVDQIITSYLGENALKDKNVYIQDFELTSLDLLKFTNHLSEKLSINLSVVDLYSNPKITDFRNFVVNKYKSAENRLSI